MALPIYDPSGTQTTKAVSPIQTNGDTFGAGIGRAMDGAGRNLTQTGAVLNQLEKQEREKDDAAAAIGASTEAQSQMREKLYGAGGILEQKGTAAEGAAKRAKQATDEVVRSVRQNIGSPEAQQAFDRMMSQYDNTLQNSVTGFEFDQRQAVRTTAKTSALSNIQADVVTHYADEEMLKTNFTQARQIIRANPDSLPAEAVQQLEREAISSLHLQVVQRMALDNPAMAMDYYVRNKGEVSGVDHTTADKMIGQISRIRDVQQGVQEIITSGPAGSIISAVMGTESGGNVFTPPSTAGAAGLMQLMPDTARETALAVGMPHVARMTDEELQAYYRTPEGARANVRMGTAYLGNQLKTFNGDLEASLIAYNAGPANATKWLNAGRDYSVLPKESETRPYVAKVIKAWKGVDIPDGAGSKEIQAAVNGSRSAYFSGDSKAFLRTRLQGHQSADHINGMSKDMSDRLAGMFSEAPDFVKAGLDILSGTRTKERQTELWDAELKKQGGDVAAARKNVAPPEGVAGSKGSQHNHGSAADLGWQGGKFAQAPKEVRDWVHANAAKYGMDFPMGHEPWHIETAEARKGGRVGRLTPDERIDMAFGNTGTDGGTVGVAEFSAAPTNAADLYAKANEPFTVKFDAPDPAVWLEQARERFADDPAKLAEAERQINIEAGKATAASKADVDAVKKDVLRSIMAGGSVKDYDPQSLEKIGHEAIGGLMTFETNWQTGKAGKTDPATYLELSQMEPADFAKVNLMDYIGKLGVEDFKKMANDQAAYNRDGAGKLSVGRTRNEIVSDAQKILALETSGKNKSANQENAVKMVALNRAVDGKIQEYVENNKKQPTGIEIQKMVDDLIVQGKVTNNSIFPDTKRYAFELTEGENNVFAPAQTFEDVPEQVKPQLATTFRKMWGINPNEEAAVGFYNDMVRVNLGGSPTPPKDIMPRIKQGLMQRLGRAATDDEIAAFYRKWILATTETK